MRNSLIFLSGYRRDTDDRKELVTWNTSSKTLPLDLTESLKCQEIIIIRVVEWHFTIVLRFVKPSTVVAAH